MQITICAIVIGGNESLLTIKLPDGFEFKKIKLKSNFISKKVRNLDGEILPHYKSNLSNDNDAQFIVITKETMYEGNLDEYKENQFRVIEKIISMLKIFKKGDICVYGIYYFIEQKNIIDQEYMIDVNPLINEKYYIRENEKTAIEKLLNNYDKEYDKLYTILAHYCNSTKYIDLFMQLQYLISIAENVTLKKREDNKIPIAKRLSVMLGKNDQEIDEISSEFIRLYRLRNNSIHNGNNEEITNTDVESARQIIRGTIKYYLQKTKSEIQENPNTTFAKVKENTIKELKDIVALKNEKGVFSIDLDDLDKN